VLSTANILPEQIELDLGGFKTAAATAQRGVLQLIRATQELGCEAASDCAGLPIFATGEAISVDRLRLCLQ